MKDKKKALIEFALLGGIGIFIYYQIKKKANVVDVPYEDVTASATAMASFAAPQDAPSSSAYQESTNSLSRPFEEGQKNTMVSPGGAAAAKNSSAQNNSGLPNCSITGTGDQPITNKKFNVLIL